jgi:hypothetical protein
VQKRWGGGGGAKCLGGVQNASGGVCKQFLGVYTPAPPRISVPVFFTMYYLHLLFLHIRFTL